MEGLDELLAPRLLLLWQAQSLNERLNLSILTATVEQGFYRQSVQPLFVIYVCLFQPCHGLGGLSHGTIHRSNIGMGDCDRPVFRREKTIDCGNSKILPARESIGMSLQHQRSKTAP